MMRLAFLVNVTAFPLFNSLHAVRGEGGLRCRPDGPRISGRWRRLRRADGLDRIEPLRRRRPRGAHDVRVLRGLVHDAPRVCATRQHPAAGIPVLVLAGCAQSLGLVPMAALLLRTSDPRFHGRIMGIRMLAIYGNLPGLLISGPLITLYGYPGHGDALLRDRPGVHPADRGALACPCLEAGRAGQRAVTLAPGQECHRHE